MKINTEITIGRSELVDALAWSDAAYTDLVSFVIKLDAALCDWDFTEALYAYFKEQHKIFKKEFN